MDNNKITISDEVKKELTKKKTISVDPNAEKHDKPTIQMTDGVLMNRAFCSKC